jgi:hypothetical protein
MYQSNFMKNSLYFNKEKKIKFFEKKIDSYIISKRFISYFQSYYSIIIIPIAIKIYL